MSTSGRIVAEESSAMLAELARDTRFTSSAFWTDLNQKNVAMLETGGIANFKRSLSQNYFNWVPALNSAIYRNAILRWLCRPTLRPFRVRVEPDVEMIFTNSPAPVKMSPTMLRRYGVFVALMWEIMLREDRAGLHTKVAEPLVGNPIRVTRAGELLSQDLAHSIIEANAILTALGPVTRPRIAEIGAGYGRLGHVFNATQGGTYCIFDIPPALSVSQWYLPQVMPGKTVFRFRPFERFEDVAAEIERADIAFFTANQITKFPPGYFDVVLSISTLPEMTPAQVKLYLDLFQKLSRRLIFVKQWANWDNTTDGTFLRPTDYVLGPRWRVVLDRTDPVIPEFFNRIWALT